MKSLAERFDFKNEFEEIMKPYKQPLEKMKQILSKRAEELIAE